MVARGVSGGVEGMALAVQMLENKREPLAPQNLEDGGADR